MHNFKLPKKQHEFCLAFLFTIFIIGNFKPPLHLASFFRSNLGKCVVLFTIAFLFIKTNPILGILSIFVAFKLLNVSNFVSFLPSQKKMDYALKSYQPTYDHLEEEIISKMKNHTVSLNATPYNPILSDAHNALPL